jgi:hypothetical protein
MTPEFYKSQMAAIEAAAQKSKRDLMLDFARKNNPYKKGDIIEDMNKKIRIDGMFVGMPFLGSLPCMVYVGVILLKNGTPNKLGKTDEIYQNNIKNI